MRSSIPNWLRRAANVAAATGLALMLATGYAQARDESDDANSSNASSSNDANSSTDRDQSSSEDNSQNKDRDSQQQSSSNNSHHQAALGVVLYPNTLEIRRVMPDSPADEAGLRRGDDILTANGQRVNSPQQLIRLVRQAGDDERIAIVVLRDGEHKTVRARLSSRDEVFGQRDGQPWEDEWANRRGNRQYSRSPQQFDRGDYGRPRYDYNNQGYGGQYGTPPEGYREEDDRFAQYRRNRRGALGVTLDEDARGPVRINHVYRDGPADEAGLRPGDEIVAVDSRQIRSTEDLLRVLANKHPREQIRLDIDRNGRERTIRATLASPNHVFMDESQDRGYRMTRSQGRQYDQQGSYDGGYTDGYQGRGRNYQYDNYEDYR